MGRALILSDIHFGKPGSRVQTVSQLKPLWQGFDTLVLNGDTAEMYSATHADVSKQLTRDLIGEATADGVRTTVICGNHDPTFSDTDYLWFCDERVLVFHGHAPFEGIAPWSWRSTYIAKSRRAAMNGCLDDFESQLRSVRNASALAASGAFSRHRPSFPRMLLIAFPAAIRVLKGWRTFPALTEQWISRYAPNAQYIITGHTHHAGTWTRNGRVIINTGCFGFPSHPRAVIIDDDEIIVRKLQKRRGVYEFGRDYASWNAR